MTLRRRRPIPDLNKRGELRQRCWYCTENRPEQLTINGSWEYRVCRTCLLKFEQEHRLRVHFKESGDHAILAICKGKEGCGNIMPPEAIGEACPKCKGVLFPDFDGNEAEFVFTCPHCGHPFCEILERSVDIHGGAIYTCSECKGRVTFEAEAV